MVSTNPVSCGFSVQAGDDACAIDRIFFLLDKAKTVKEFLQIHSLIVRQGFHRNSTVCSKLQLSYTSSGRHDFSTSVFRSVRNPNVYSWTDMIRSHAIRGLDDQAMNYYYQMINSGVAPNSYSLSSALESSSLEFGRCIQCHAIKLGLFSDIYVRTSLINAYARGRDLPRARRVFDLTPEKGVVPSTAMLTGYAKNGDLEEARLIFNGMEVKDLVCWGAMIDGYNRHGNSRSAFLLFEELMSTRMYLNDVIILSLLSTCKHLGFLNWGRWIHNYLKTNRIRINLRLSSSLIDMYSKCGSIVEARRVFDETITNRDAVVWNAMIFGYAMHGFSDQALQLFDEMRRSGCVPIHTTFIAVLNACGQSEMAKAKLEDEVSDLALYRSAVNSVDHAANSVDNAAAGKVKARPSFCSWIELDNRIHCFDESGIVDHPRKEQMVMKLGEIDRWLAESPACDGGSGGGEIHTEKLAVAFGLLNAGEEELKIVNTHHFCGGCHSLMKTISKVAGVRIAVRDGNRFHHFIDGSCSCKDRWVSDRSRIRTSVESFDCDPLMARFPHHDEGGG